MGDGDLDCGWIGISDFKTRKSIIGEPWETGGTRSERGNSGLAKVVRTQGKV